VTSTTTQARTSLRHQLRDESGLAAGAEALVFGVLVFVFGTLLVLNAWAVIDTKFATSAAAREAVRAAVEAPAGSDGGGMHARAQAAAAATIDGHGIAATRMTLTPTTAIVQTRCAPVGFRVSVHVPATIVPGWNQSAGVTVTSTYAEVVDPYRSGLSGEVDCAF
jgi:hypothetical protein